MKIIPPFLLILLLCSFFVNGQQLTQNFESGTFPPTGWIINPSNPITDDTWETATTAADGGFDNNGNSFTVNPHGGTGMAQFRAYDFFSGTTAELISSAVNLTTGAPHVLKFWLSQDDGYQTNPDSIAVYINTTQSFTGAIRISKVTRPIATPQQQWTQFTFNIPPAFNTATNYIIFKAYSRFGNNLFIDDVSVESGPTCVTPTGINVSAITTSSATISWTAGIGTTTGYEWAVTTSVTPPASGTSTTLISANATGLTPATNYFAHIRTKCGAAFSGWETLAFATLCNPVSIPYTENFDGVTAPALPTCIKTQDINAGTTWNNGTTAPRSLPNCMIYNYSSTLPADDWFYSAPLNLTSGISYRVSFYYKARGSSFPESMEVKYGSASTAVSMTNLLVSYPNITQTSYQLSETDFTPATTGTYFIGFHANSIANQFDLNVDDISVTLTPSCGSPSALAVALSSNTAGTASWTVPVIGIPTGYEYIIDNTLANPAGSGTSNVGTSVPFTGLTPLTQYYLHIRTNCGGSFSSWSTLAFVTLINDQPCGAIALTLGGAADCGNTTAATSVNDPTLSCSTPNNTLWYKYTPTANGAVNIQLNQNGGPTGQLNAWIQIYTAAGSCPALTLTEVNTAACLGSVDLTTVTSGTLTTSTLTAGTTYYFIVDGVSGASGAYCIQLVAPPLPPTCVTNVSPANGATGIVLGPGATAPITWNTTAAATGYDIYFGTVNPPTANIGTIAAPTVTATINNLQYDTTYYWYVVPVNTGGAATGCNTNTTSFKVQSPPTNCVPLYGTGTGQNCSGGDLISLFRLKGESSELNINTGTACNSPIGYIDSTDHAVIIDLARGKSYWGQVKCGFNLNTIAIWIDFNNNGLFEVTEKMMNNLVVGTTLTNFNMFIPLGSATGNHRMRVRNVYSPTGAIDACGLYTYGETEDYTINIASSGSVFNVATYTPTGSCYTGAGDIVVDALSNNNNALYIPLVDSSNNIIAQLYPDGNNLGRVTTSYYKHNAAVRQSGSIYYLDRNITITVNTPPTTTYRLRYFYQNAELNALIAQSGSGVTSQFDIKCTKNSNGCVSAVAAGGAGVLVTPTGFGTIGTDRFIDMVGLTGFSSFYLHGGSAVLPIKVEYLRGIKQGNNHLLDWKVGCNSSQFANLSLEVSEDTRNFRNIYSTRETALRCQQPFSFLNTQPLAGISYYRLKMTDDNGEVAYSNIVALLNKAKGFEFVSIAPNPVTDGSFKLNITSAEQKKMEIMINDIAGRVVSKRSLNLIAGFNTIDMNVDNLAKGTYTIQGIVEGEKLKLIRFVKQ
jgi:GEVED domain/Secretion system C-terminal sorting domain